MRSSKKMAESIMQLPQFDSTSLLLLRNLISSWQFVKPITKDDHPFCAAPKKKRTPRREPATGQEEEKKVLLSETRLGSKRELEAAGEEKEVRANKIKKVIGVPVEVRQNIETRGGSAIKLMIEKKLTSSDLEKGQNRLLMPESKVDNSFLEGGEEESRVMDGIQVQLLEPCGVVSSMKLKIWNMRSNRNYVLIANSKEVTWNTVTRREENIELGVFKKGNTIRVWSFRVEGQPWLTFEQVAEPARGGDHDHDLDNNGEENLALVLIQP